MSLSAFPSLISLSALFFVWLVFSFRFPVASIVSFPLFFPLYLVRFFVGSLPLSVPEVFLLAQITSFLFLWAQEWYRKKNNFFFRTFHWFFQRFRFLIFWKREPFDFRTSPFVPVVILIFALVISLAITPPAFFDRGLGIFKSWFLFPILYFFLFLRLVPGMQSTRRALDFYSLSALFLAGWGIYQWVSGRYLTPDMRASGPFESANYLALYLAPACVYLLLRFFHLWRTQRNMALALYFFSAVISLFALYQTKSFGAFLGVFIALILYVLFSLRARFSWKKIILVVASIFLLGTVFFVTGDRNKFDALFQFSERSSSAVRLEVWKISGQFIREHPILGIGFATFQPLYEQRAVDILRHPPYEASILHPHNLFLMFWLSSGLLGLSAFIWLMILFFVKFFRSIPVHRMSLATILATMMVVLLVHGLVDVPILKNDLALQFWLLTAGMFRLTHD